MDKLNTHAALSARFPQLNIMDVNMTSFDGKIGKFLGVFFQDNFITNPFLSANGAIDVDSVEEYGVPPDAAKAIVAINKSRLEESFPSNFETRRNPDFGNLLLSYGVKEDEAAVKHGYEFLGACKDNQGNEVHVFCMEKLDVFQARQ